MPKRSLLAATVLTVAATPAVASAATVTVDRPCYSAGSSQSVGDGAQKVGFTLAGFPASSMVEVGPSVGNGTFGTVDTDPNGGFLGEFPVDSLPERVLRKTFPLAASTFDGSVSATATYTVAAAAVSMVPSVARPTTKVAYKVQGFVGGKAIYAHYAYTKSEVSHPLLKTVKLGTLTGPCGDLTTKKGKQLPFAKLKRKTVYEIQFDTSPTYKRQQGVYFTRTVFVP